jgi:glutamate-1-semialdehyde 2,1-aminomutase
MVKFTKDGSTATSGAVKLARAITGRSTVAFCGDHPFFSYDDWFIGRTAVDAGIPQAIKDLSATFRYNDLASLERLFAEHPGDVACVILEPEKNDPPQDGFLLRVQELCRREGALLILDEMISGFRFHLHGAQAEYGLDPDLSTFGKALGNGFAVSALAGKREHMERGGLHHDGERVFLLSTTHGAENHALAAAIAVIEHYRDRDVVGGLAQRGEYLRAGIERVVAELGMEAQFGLLGRPSNLVFFTRDAEGRPSDPLRTIFQQEMARRGVLVPSFVMTVAHDTADLDQTVEAVGESLEVYARAMEEGPEAYLVGEPTKSVYRRFN